jgi:general stress protein 26
MRPGLIDTSQRGTIMTASNDILQNLMNDFGVAMLITHAEGGRLRARPMVLADIEPNGTVWLITDHHSGKVEEIVRDHHVNVTMQSSSKFVSLSGMATAVHDAKKVAELWKETWKVWFPSGKDDPNLVLLKVDGDSGEYWDNSGYQGIKYLIEAGKAYMRGSKPEVSNDARMHGTVKL